MAISILFNPMPQRIFEADGDFASGAKAYFYLARTTTPLTVYTDAPLEVPHTWPVVADAFGLLAPIYIGKGTEYKVRIEDENGNLLYAADGIDNPAEPTGGEGGDGGLVITAAQIYKTGDFDWQPTTANRDGWLRSNGLKIGKAVSSTADIKSDDYHDLFISLWNNFSNTLCPVSGGRGTNAMLDWNDAKSIGTLDMRGYGNAGLDDMGTTAANRIQVSTNLAVTFGSVTANVGSSVGLCIGMFIHCPALIPVGTKIATIISPTAITMTAGASVSNGGTPARFSIVQDAQAAGSGGGENTHVQLLPELAAHTHTVVGASGVAYIDAAGVNLTTGGSDGAAGNTSLAVVGESRPMNIHTPTRLGTWWVKI